MKYFILLLISFFIVLGCKKKNTSEESDLQTICFDFESTLEDWKNLGGSGERKFESDIEITSELSYSGAKSCKFTISPESNVANGNRAELTFDEKAIEGDDSWYEWVFYIPESYQDVSLEDSTGAPNWQVIGQWHQQPNFAAGETWDNYSEMGKSVPIAVNYYYFSNNDPEYLKLKQDPKSDVLHGFNKDWNEVSVVGLSYGDSPSSIAVKKIEKNTWYKIRLNIKWSQNDDGFVQAWIDEEEFTNGKHYGLNMLNEVSHYFKFGLYRNPTIPYTNSLYYDDIKVWNSNELACQ